MTGGSRQVVEHETLYYDLRDDRGFEARGLRLLYWLDDLDAAPIQSAASDAEGFLFAGARSMADYRRLVAPHPRLADRPESRTDLLRLDSVLARLGDVAERVGAPRTWMLQLDQPLPASLRFPLFIRTAASSWKVGGGSTSRVDNPEQLEAEAAALRRVFGWDEVILAREWLELAPAGRNVHGPVPQEIRTWVVDGTPVAWSFHHLHGIQAPLGFPPDEPDLYRLAEIAALVAGRFSSRLVVVDVARRADGGWALIEAGPGSCAGTAHEAVYKAVARCLLGRPPTLAGDDVGGPLPQA